MIYSAGACAIQFLRRPLFSFLFFCIFRLFIGAPPFGVLMLVLVKVTIQTTVENGNL